MSKKILILFAHPMIRKSKVHARLNHEIKDLEGITINDLYENYPNFDIDVEREKELLVNHDVIIFQHPLYWYSTPSILKEWQDLVLQHNFAFGKDGDALHGKYLINVVSVGGPQISYQGKGQGHLPMTEGKKNDATVRELFCPMEQTANLCGMSYLAPYVVFGAHGITEDEIRQEALDYRQFLEWLRDDKVNLEKAQQVKELNFREVKSF